MTLNLMPTAQHYSVHKLHYCVNTMKALRTNYSTIFYFATTIVLLKAFIKFHQTISLCHSCSMGLCYFNLLTVIAIVRRDFSCFWIFNLHILYFSEHKDKTILRVTFIIVYLDFYLVVWYHFPYLILSLCWTLYMCFYQTT